MPVPYGANTGVSRVSVDRVNRAAETATRSRGMPCRSAATTDANSYASCTTRSGRQSRHASSSAGSIAAIPSRPNTSVTIIATPSSGDSASTGVMARAISSWGGSPPMR